MPQQQKVHVREAILAAARRRLAEHGLQGASLAAIAADAETSVGNLYKYFADKEALFVAAVPPGLAAELRALLRRQVEALGTERDADELGEDHPYQRAAAETRAFSIEHRLELLFLLRHAKGTGHPSLADDVAADLTRLSVDYVRRAYPGFPLTASNRRALRRIYQAYVTSITDILAVERSDQTLAAATGKLAVYHLAGLRAFFTAATAAEPDETP